MFLDCSAGVKSYPTSTFGLLADALDQLPPLVLKLHYVIETKERETRRTYYLRVRASSFRMPSE
jgi:hypothetical protein